MTAKSSSVVVGFWEDVAESMERCASAVPSRTMMTGNYLDGVGKKFSST